jgi:hypothetical protein
MSNRTDIDETARRLVERHGLAGAGDHAMKRIAELHETGDLYALSVWREIRTALAELAGHALAGSETENG